MRTPSEKAARDRRKDLIVNLRAKLSRIFHREVNYYLLFILPHVEVKSGFVSFFFSG
jgi:hypothetical protein